MKYLTTTLFALLIINFVTAQVPASVSVGAAGPYPEMTDGFSITLAGVDEGFVEDSWRQFISSYDGTTGQILKNDGGSEMKSIGVLFPPLEYERVDILGVVRSIPSYEDNPVVLLTIWIHRADNSLLVPVFDEEVTQKSKDWLFSFDSQLDRNSFSKD